MIWDEGFWPDELWQLLENLVPVGAIAAFIGAVLYLWKRGPGWLIKHGPEWMTRLGHKWEGKREGDNGNN